MDIRLDIVFLFGALKGNLVLEGTGRRFGGNIGTEAHRTDGGGNMVVERRDEVDLEY